MHGCVFLWPKVTGIQVAKVGLHSPGVLESWGPGMEGREPKLQKLVKDKAGL